jgi:hypothetical protein
MLRIHFLQQWFNLSDPAVEEALYILWHRGPRLQGHANELSVLSAEALPQCIPVRSKTPACRAGVAWMAPRLEAVVGTRLPVSGAGGVV